MVRPLTSKLEELVEENPQYLWLRDYLQGDLLFLKKSLWPVLQGRTHSVVADFPNNPGEPPWVRSFVGSQNIDELHEVLTSQNAQTQVRLIFVTSTSGVGDEARRKVRTYWYYSFAELVGNMEGLHPS
jgi:hypothetical protein